MPAQIVLVHDDPKFAKSILGALHQSGYNVVAYGDSMSATKALEHPERIELLITRVRFPPGTPNGTALARMALVQRPGIRVLFTSFPEVRSHTEGLGQFLPRPFATTELLQAVGKLLDR